MLRSRASWREGSVFERSRGKTLAIAIPIWTKFPKRFLARRAATEEAKTEQRAVLEAILKQLGLSKLEDWYLVPAKRVSDLGGTIGISNLRFQACILRL